MHIPLIAPLFIEDGNFTSELVLVNGSDKSTYADVALRSLDGNIIAQKHISFTPLSQQQLAIEELLREVNSSATSGSITVMQSPDLQGMTINVQLSLTYLGSKEPS